MAEKNTKPQNSITTKNYSNRLETKMKLTHYERLQQTKSKIYMYQPVSKDATDV